MKTINISIVFLPLLVFEGDTLDNGFEDAFQYTVLGNSHNRLKSTNLLERLNQEVRRREKIIRIFPNHASAIHHASPYGLD